MDNHSGKIKKIFAICTVLIILLLYITTFILAIMNNAYTDMFFNASLFATVFVPVIIYIAKWLSDTFKN